MSRLHTRRRATTTGEDNVLNPAPAASMIVAGCLSALVLSLPQPEQKEPSAEQAVVHQTVLGMPELALAGPPAPVPTAGEVAAPRRFGVSRTAMPFDAMTPCLAPRGARRAPAEIGRMAWLGDVLQPRSLPDLPAPLLNSFAGPQPQWTDRPSSLARTQEEQSLAWLRFASLPADETAPRMASGPFAMGLLELPISVVARTSATRNLGPALPIKRDSATVVAERRFALSMFDISAGVFLLAVVMVPLLCAIGAQHVGPKPRGPPCAVSAA